MSYGTQVGTLWTASGPDMDPYGRRVTGPTAVMHSVARMLHTPRGALSWDRRIGFDVRAQLNSSMTAGRLVHIQSQCRAQCLLDERVENASVTASFNESTSTLTLEIEIDLADEDELFSFVLAVSEVTTALLMGTA